MGLPKGTTNNPNGRPKGQPNKITAEVKDLLKDLVNTELEQLPQRLAKLDDRDRVEVLVKLLPFVLPKVKTAPSPTKGPKRPPIEWVDTNSENIEQPLNLSPEQIRQFDKALEAEY